MDSFDITEAPSLLAPQISSCFSTHSPLSLGRANQQSLVNMAEEAMSSQDLRTKGNEAYLAGEIPQGT